MLPKFLIIAYFGGFSLICGYAFVRLCVYWFIVRDWKTADAKLQKLTVAPKYARFVRANPRITAEYTYEVAGKRYQGHRISYLEGPPYFFNGYEPHRVGALEDQFQAGAAVSIRYDPKQPHKSFLIDMPALGMIACAGIFAVASAIVLALTVYFDTSDGSILVGWVLAVILLLLSMVTRDWWVAFFAVG